MEEVEEHLASAGIICKEQEQARGEITSARKTLKIGHITLHYQFLELINNTENVKEILFLMREQYQCDDQRDQQQEQGGDSATSHPGGRHSART